MYENSQEQQLSKRWPQSQLMTAISCLTYGVNCQYFSRTGNKIMNCTLSIHEQFINILHVIVEAKFSILFQLQNIKSISDKDIFIRNTLRQLKYEYFIVLYTGNLESYVLVMRSQNEKNVIWEGLQFFIHEGINFYERISKMDPFKAEITMLFLEADADGSSLLDVDEVENIFKTLKINCDRLEIKNSILEINSDLYDRENLFRPKGFTNQSLTPLGFQYILRYYSMKASIAPIFSEFCPIFKFKHKKFKKTIIDILKSQNKPLMSGIQLKQFLQKYLKLKLSERQCTQMIKAFPTYDGEGKQIPEEVQFLSFNTFSSLVFSLQNSLIRPQFTKLHQDMTQPLTEYYVYSSSNTYLSGTSLFSDSKLEMYEHSLKKGCRCLELDIQNIGDNLVVKHKNSKNSINLADVLTTIKNIGFSINKFPIILSIQMNFPSSMGAKVRKIFQQQIGQSLYVMSSAQKQANFIPSPQQLQKRIILQAVDVFKETDNPFYRLFSLVGVKLDFERKGYTCNSTCQIKVKNILNHQTIEEKNLVDYCRKVMVRTLPNESKDQLENYDPMPMFRNGVQIISFNLQREDEHHYFMHSKFLENGGKSCGYLLKPYWLQSTCHENLYSSNFQKPVFTIKLKVFCGQKIILANTQEKQFYLEVYLKGVQLDQKLNKKYVSDSKNQGFYTDFELECEFIVRCVDLAHFVFSIVDKKGQIMSYRAISLVYMREGLRTVQLLGPGMELYLNSCLIVLCEIKEDKRKRRLSDAFG